MQMTLIYITKKTAKYSEKDFEKDFSTFIQQEKKTQIKNENLTAAKTDFQML